MEGEGIVSGKRDAWSSPESRCFYRVDHASRLHLPCPGGRNEVKKRILVVEDDLPTRQLLNVWLTAEGYEVRFAMNSSSTFEVLNEWKPDLMLIDILLPNELGFGICESIRQTMRIPIVMMTARTLDSDRDTALSVGADDFIQKPFDWSDLVNRIKHLLRENNRNPLPVGSAA